MCISSKINLVSLNFIKKMKYNRSTIVCRLVVEHKDYLELMIFECRRLLVSSKVWSSVVLQ